MFDLLPTEIKLLVFSHLEPEELLNLAGPVCQKWQDLANDPILWKRIWLDGRKQSPDQQKRMFKNNRLARILLFYHFSNWNLMENLPKFNFLRGLKFEHCNVSADIVKKFVEQCPLIDRFHIFHDDYDQQIICQVVRWKFLKEFWCYYTTTPSVAGSEILDLFTNCKYLVSFSLGFAETTISDTSLSNFIKIHGASLETLHLGYSNTTDFHFGSLSTCTNLKKLYFQPSSTTTVSGWLNLKKLHSLEWLIMYNVLNDPADSIDALFRGTRFSLNYCQFWDLEYMDDNSLEIFAKSCPSLRTLEIHYCKNITDKGIDSVLSHCVNIEKLIFCELSVTGSSLVKVLPSSALVKVKFIACPHVNHDVVSEAKARKPDLKISTFPNNPLRDAI